MYRGTAGPAGAAPTRAPPGALFPPNPPPPPHARAHREGGPQSALPLPPPAPLPNPPSPSLPHCTADHASPSLPQHRCNPTHPCNYSVLFHPPPAKGQGGQGAGGGRARLGRRARPLPGRRAVRPPRERAPADVLGAVPARRARALRGARAAAAPRRSVEAAAARPLRSAAGTGGGRRAEPRTTVPRAAGPLAAGRARGRSGARPPGWRAPAARLEFADPSSRAAS